MEHEFRIADRPDYSAMDNIVAEDGFYPLQLPLGHEVVGRGDGARVDGLSVADSPFLTIPADVLRHLITYLWTSDTMALRCSAQVVKRNLAVWADAILDGCQRIDHVMEGGNLHSISSPEVIAEFLTVRLDVRCNLIARYAKQAGLKCFTESGYIDPESRESSLELRRRYMQRPSYGSPNEKSQSEASWRRLIDTTKSMLRDTVFDISQSVALSNLYAAEIYAPLLSVISDPVAHASNVVKEAYANLSPLRYMDFLYAVRPVKVSCEPVGKVYYTLVSEFDRGMPIPRVDVFAPMIYEFFSILEWSSVREVCLRRIGISAQSLADDITPRVTPYVVETILRNPFLSGMEKGTYLRSIVSNWGDDDGSFAISLHQSFVHALAKKKNGESKPWSSLSEPVRTSMLTSVLSIPSGDTKSYGLEGRAIVEFWALYFEICCPNAFRFSREVTERVQELPWPLQATLWALAADIHAVPERTLLDGAVKHDMLAVFSDQLDTLYTEALNARRPQCAMRLLRAELRWRMTQACSLFWNETSVLGIQALTEHTEVSPRIRQHVSFSDTSWRIFETCSVSERLPFVAALFGYRDLPKIGALDQQYGALVSKTVSSFLCDPLSALTQPSREIVAVLLHYLPSCITGVPEYVFELDARNVAIAKRFDLPLADVMHALGAPKESLSSLPRDRL